MLNQELKVSPHKSFKVTQLCESVAICEAMKSDRHRWGNGTETEPAFVAYLGCKRDEVASYIRHQEALSTARKEEARKIQALAKQAENEAGRLRKYLIAQMVRSDIKRIDRVRTKIGLRKKQPQVLLNVPTEELPPEYVKVTYKADLTKIRALLKGDTKGEIDWASLSESHQYSVTIR